MVSEMDLKDLSSNWKKLQKTLHSTCRPPKRKASEDLHQRQYHGAKRRKPGGNEVQAIQPGKRYQKRRVMEDETVLEVPVVPRKIVGRVNEGLSSATEAGKYLSLDCEMVGVGPNPDQTSALARVSIVNYHGVQVYDSYVRPKEFVTDWRTPISGILPSHMRNARSLEEVQAAVAGLLNGKILVGHGVRHDLEMLMLGHPKRDVRDTSRHPAFRRLAMGKTPSLKRLAKEVLGFDIQGGEHSSVEDARACMLLFQREKNAFELEHAKRWGTKTRSKQSEEGHEQGKKRKKKKRGKK